MYIWLGLSACLVCNLPTKIALSALYWLFFHHHTPLAVCDLRLSSDNIFLAYAVCNT